MTNAELQKEIDQLKTLLAAKNMEIDLLRADIFAMNDKTVAFRRNLEARIKDCQRELASERSQ